MTTCPYCAEEIQAEAAKCKHCGEWLDPSRRPVEHVSAPQVAVASTGKPNYAAYQLYRYEMVGPNQERKQGLIFGKDPAHATSRIKTILPAGFEIDKTRGFQIEPKGTFSCPNCGSQFTNCKRDVGCAVGIIIFISLGLGLLLIPLLPYRCECQACKFTWKS